ncbi:class I SAM-dependent methyltransferase [Ensifer sp. ENS07]|jgi:16S rRNA (guanine1207-N2)-methyltransferase|uniref:Class I SAM-dependent methyltransferase n=1 Tax=Ensifer adhaerens TaxID=106592 RepID=A0A9Q9D937_ENSAD|nr:MULTISPECIES: class I SAM-dependent methyltransferase [Ensifer]KSV66450.1 methyltransferase [Sinorhizobium sp. GW3]KSV82418.1 methyltransferase [Sinorhizobium sp. GL2]MBD9492430.1 class I SAM-dependent methyltransferase [Ensifer sp. ENS01]MBD9519810.1 class I SAM-dependent methyltransferase [Ensifer sp. ENS02]MBD9567863.1 class I SAM-dependent methyltransferase [Ensifer sp. ENS08]
MSRDSLKTLFYPFDSGVIDPPGEGERVLFLGAEAGYRLPQGFEASISAVQPLRPLYRALEAARADVAPEITGEDYDVTLILCGKHKGENEDRIAEALKRTREGGLIVVAGGKEDGIQSLKKRIAKFEWDGDHLPKYHGVAFWFTRPEDVTDAVQKLAKVPVRVDGLFEASPGMFSHDRIDAGSELLASRLPNDFHGHAADFGAGWGYLAAKLAEASPGTKGVDLFEADHEALEAARVNMMANAPRMPARFYWFDLTSEEPRDKYDLIVMNPPFHEGHAAEPSLGVAIIKTALKALKQGGKLMMVANRGLPYEQVLAENSKEYGETCRNARFKVLWAKR